LAFIFLKTFLFIYYDNNETVSFIVWQRDWLYGLSIRHVVCNCCDE